MTTFTYDSVGRMLSQRDTHPANPGNLLVYLYEHGAGMVYTMEHSYVTEGGLALTTTDNFPLGSVNRTVTRSYSCP